MVFKKNIFIRGVLLATFFWGMGNAHDYQEVPELPFKPLCLATPFSKTLNCAMDMWNKIVHARQEAELSTQLVVLARVTKLLHAQKEMVHAGNLEYLLAIFDAMEQNVSHEGVLLTIQAIKKTLVELL